MEYEKRYGVKDAARRLGLGEFTLRRIVRMGGIAYYRPVVRGPIYFWERQIIEFEQKHTFEPNGGEIEKAA